jgi:Putative Actinobacterial Holin-X, holin superfamily III
MPEPTTEDQRAAKAGLFGHVAGFLAGLSEYLRVRLQLAGLEAKEAAIHFAIIVGLLVGVLVVVVLGYLFFCIALIFAIDALVQGRHTWIWLTFAMALAHFALGIAAALVIRARLGAPVFSATLDEFKKDQQWLNSMTAKQR